MATASDFVLTVPAAVAGQQVSVVLSRPSRQYVASFTAAVAGLEEAVPMTVLSESDTKVIYGMPFCCKDAITKCIKPLSLPPKLNDFIRSFSSFVKEHF